MKTALLSIMIGLAFVAVPAMGKGSRSQKPAPGYAQAAAYFEKHEVSKEVARVLPKKKVGKNSEKSEDELKIKLTKNGKASKKQASGKEVKKSEKRKITNVEKKSNKKVDKKSDKKNKKSKKSVKKDKKSEKSKLAKKASKQSKKKKRLAQDR